MNLQILNSVYCIYAAVLGKEIWMWGKPPSWTMDMNIPRLSAVWENYEETEEGTTQAVGNAESGSRSGCK